ncbi:hypothetical protein [Bacteroides sp. 519]|uniref:hypothetical protein n=1 Tax=Bacteroides sp. 519 TaxID=2302937 RepID=UPI0013D28CE7|nr:hypothetical protein [Bacteroides sp. 519]NDV58636.1 hypothetical protein [Bacteroides sp. 519]
MTKVYLVLTMIFSYIMVSSCTNEVMHTDLVPDRGTLTGSISFSTYYYMNGAEGVYNGKGLEDYQPWSSFFYIKKVSEKEVSIHCVPKWGTSTLDIFVPLVPVNGKPHNATFDYSTKDAVIKCNTDKEETAEVSIKGWIKEEGFTRDIHIPNYECEIEIDCTVNQERLKIKITSIERS